MSQDALNNLSENYTGASQDFSMDYVYRRNLNYFQPLGKLSRQQLKQAEDTLKAIQMELSEAQNTNRLMELTNQFYTLVPTQDLSKLPVINTPELLQEKFLLLQALKE